MLFGFDVVVSGILTGAIGVLIVHDRVDIDLEGITVCSCASHSKRKDYVKLIPWFIAAADDAWRARQRVKEKGRCLGFISYQEVLSTLTYQLEQDMTLNC